MVGEWWWPVSVILIDSHEHWVSCVIFHSLVWHITTNQHQPIHAICFNKRIWWFDWFFFCLVWNLDWRWPKWTMSFFFGLYYQHFRNIYQFLKQMNCVQVHVPNSDRSLKSMSTWQRGYIKPLMIQFQGRRRTDKTKLQLKMSFVCIAKAVSFRKQHGFVSFRFILIFIFIFMFIFFNQK